MEFNPRASSLSALFLAAVMTAQARPIDLSKLDKDVFDRLQAKASDSVDVSLDSNVIRMGARFLEGQTGDAAKIKKLIDGLKSITVRSYTFDKKGEYTEADVQKIRDQVRSPEWSRIVNAHSKADGENSEIYLMTVQDKPAGLLIIASEPNELTVVHIVGSVDLKDLDALDALDLGIPSMGGHDKKDHPDKDGGK
jgi:hypothetical protein